MSENVSDTFKNLAQTATDAVTTRLSGAFSTYVFTSWLFFNWSNIAFLFLSNLPIEKRITAIYLQDYLYLRFLISPILAGLFLSISIPFINSNIVRLTSRFSAISEASMEEARAAFQEQIAARIQKKTEIDANITELIRQNAKLKVDLEELRTEYEALKDLCRPYELGMRAIILRTSRLISELREIKGAENLNPDEFIKLLQGLFSDEEFTAAGMWYERLISDFGYEIARGLVENKTNIFVDMEMIKQALEQAASQTASCLEPESRKQ